MEVQSWPVCHHDSKTPLIFLFQISGIAVLTIGSIVKAKEPDYAYIGKDVFGVSILLIVVGLLVAAIAFLGCCGAVRESRCMLYSVSSVLMGLHSTLDGVKADKPVTVRSLPARIDN